MNVALLAALTAKIAVMIAELLASVNHK